MANLNVNGTLEFQDIVGVGATALLNKVYPVGSIYISTNSTSPASLLGGTWEKIRDKFLLSESDTISAGSTGGEATHTLTISEMPSHNHRQTISNTFGDDTNGFAHSETKYNLNYWLGGYTLETGGSQAHNNMPPYLAVYMWKRTA